MNFKFKAVLSSITYKQMLHYAQLGHYNNQFQHPQTNLAMRTANTVQALLPYLLLLNKLPRPLPKITSLFHFL